MKKDIEYLGISTITCLKAVEYLKAKYPGVSINSKQVNDFIRNKRYLTTEGKTDFKLLQKWITETKEVLWHWIDDANPGKVNIVES